MPEDVPQLLLAELLYDHPPQLTAELLRDRVAPKLPNARLLLEKPEAGLAIAHEGDTVTLQDGKKLVLLSLLFPSERVEPDRLEPALRQTWNWPAARDAVGKATHKIMLTEMLGRAFDPEIRVRDFTETLLRVVEALPPLAVHCHHAERIIDPATVVRASGSVNNSDRLMSILNVRLFRIDNGRPGEMVMDTRGLAALGIPDLQIHFSGLEPGRVAAMLYNSAIYLYENGDCIEDGHTIAGLSADQKWTCQHEMSLIAPKRIVLDIDPGDPYAAGNRKREKKS